MTAASRWTLAALRTSVLWLAVLAVLAASASVGRIVRPWYELPVIALILLFLAVFVLALRRDLREMQTIAATGRADVALAERVQGWSPVRRVVLREIPGTIPTGWGRSLPTTAARAGALVAQGRVGVVRRDETMMNRMYLAADLPPPRPLRPAAAPLPPRRPDAM